MSERERVASVTFPAVPRSVRLYSMPLIPHYSPDSALIREPPAGIERKGRQDVRLAYTHGGSPDE